MSEEKKAALAPHIRAEFDRILRELPEPRRAALRELEKAMTATQTEAYYDNIWFFIERANQVHRNLVSEYVRGNKDRRQALGRRLKQLRKLRGYKRQEQLAEAAGVGVETISRIENGQNTEIDTLGKIFGALGVEMENPAEILLTFDREWFLDRLNQILQGNAVKWGEETVFLPPHLERASLENVVRSEAVPQLSPLNYPVHPASTNRGNVPRGEADDSTTARLRELEDRVEAQSREIAALRNVLDAVVKEQSERDRLTKATQNTTRRGKRR